MLRKTFMIATVAVALVAAAQSADAQIRLIGMTGNQSQDDFPTIPQEAFFDIDITDASSTLVGRVLFSADSQSIAFNPDDGLLYHTGGAESYRSGADRVDDIGYRDNQHMETFDPADLTPGDFVVPSTAIFNANGPNLPADPPIQVFGLPAPRPAWILPAEPRSSTQIEESFENMRGEDEYHSLRGMAWSASQSLFFGSDELGIFTMTTDGVSNFIGRPREDLRNVKGIVILNVDGQEKLYVGTNQQTGNDETLGVGSELIEVDMTTGLEIDSMVLKDPVLPTIGARGILGLSVHPETGVLYAVTHSGEFDAHDEHPELRELITIDPITGDTASIGVLNLNISSIAFTYPVEDPGVLGDTNDDRVVDIVDLNNVRNNFGDAGLGDTNDDGIIDIVDLNNVRNNFGAGAPGEANAVPEPSTALLVLCGLAAIGFRFRRK